MKITLMDIMESLNGDNMEDAQAALHEWFVEQSKTVHNNLTNPGAPTQVAEAGGQSFDVYVEIRWPNDMASDPEGFEDGDAPEATFNYEGLVKAFQANSAEEAKAMAQAEIDDIGADEAFTAEELQDSYGWTGRSSGYGDGPEGIEIYKVEPAATTEGVVDEADDAFSTMQSRQVQGKIQPAMPNGDPSTDAAGWLYIAQKIAFTFDASDGTDDMHAEDLGEIQDCANDAAASFREGDIDGGVSALCPSANAQDYLSGFEDMPEAYEQYMFSHVYKRPAAESAMPTFEELVADLSESFQGLETVSDKLQNVEGAQVGEQGKVPVNTKAALPSHKGKDRVAGEPVEIKGKGHTGHALEKAPKVADVKVKGNVQNSKDDPSKVTAPKGALLNKMDGSVNTQSPISGKGAKGLKK